VPAFDWLYLLGGTPGGGAVWATTDGIVWSRVEATTPWKDVTDAPVVRLQGQLAAVGGVTTLPGPGGSGGAAFSPSVYVTTASFFCDEDGVVCSGHGTCASFGEAAGGGYEAVGAASAVVGPFGVDAEASNAFPSGFHCVCDEGWSSPDCSKEVCSPVNCIHGKCVPKTHDLAGPGPNASLAAAPVGAAASLGAIPLVCMCDTGWLLPTCVVPVCRSGCSRDHGSCALPGRCDCENAWRGDLCDRRETVFERLGAWVQLNAAAVYGVVTSMAMAATVAYGCGCNAVLRGPAAAHGMALLKRRRKPRGGGFAPRAGGYGTMSSQPPAPASGWDERGVVPDDGFTPARDTRAPRAAAAAAAAGEVSLSGDQLLGRGQRQERYASVAGVSLAPMGSPARQARRPMSVLSGASDGSSTLGAPLGRPRPGGRGGGRRESNPFGL